MLSFVPLTPAQRMPTLAPGCGYNPDLASVEQCQDVQQLVSVCSGLAQPGPARVLIPVLSEDPALNSSCNTGKRSNWGIFYIINSDEQPPHPLSPLSLRLHTYSLSLSLCVPHSHTFFQPNLFLNVSLFPLFHSDFLIFSVPPVILIHSHHKKFVQFYNNPSEKLSIKLKSKSETSKSAKCFFSLNCAINTVIK